VLLVTASASRDFSRICDDQCFQTSGDTPSNAGMIALPKCLACLIVEGSNCAVSHNQQLWPPQALTHYGACSSSAHEVYNFALLLVDAFASCKSHQGLHERRQLA
jgi:hypothetical protein